MPAPARPGLLGPLRAEDALFLHAQTPLLSQQVGALLLLEPAPLGIGDLRTEMRQRTRALPELGRRIEPPRSRWRRPHWVPDEDTNAEDRVRQVTLGHAGAPGTLAEAVGAFFSVPCDPYCCPWEVLLVRGVPAGRAAVVVKVHHTLGDSHAIIAALTKLFDPDTGQGSETGMRHPRPARGPAGRSLRPRARIQAAARAAQGLAHLAAAGTAPAASVCGPFTAGRRRYVPVPLPAREVARTARNLNASISDLLLTMIAEALGRLLRSRGEDTAGRTIRIAVPRARPPAAGTCQRSSGNRSAAVALDLPIGPLPVTERLDAVRGQIEAHLRRGEPDASALVLRALNFLPPPLQRRAAAQLYQRRWFNMLVSIFPGTRRNHRLLGALVEEVYPVLALADGVGLAIGAMTWERSLSVGILADAALVPDVDRLAAELTDAFAGCRAAASQPAQA